MFTSHCNSVLMFSTGGLALYMWTFSGFLGNSHFVEDLDKQGDSRQLCKALRINVVRWEIHASERCDSVISVCSGLCCEANMMQRHDSRHQHHEQLLGPTYYLQTLNTSRSIRRERYQGGP
ncbi:hypothetical protein EDB85DRAFT_443011 [Lactarius pseudohatsudake]|nr:hypothetical protein EDB85DRAFT_443011 [Lactarius pseudohatsudake]